MQFLNLLLFLNGWDKSPFDAYLKSLVLSLAGGKKPSVVSLVSESPSYKGDAVQFFFLPIYGEDGHGWLSSSREFRASEQAGSGDSLFFFGVGIENLGGLELRLESFPSDCVAPNHLMIKRK